MPQIAVIISGSAGLIGDVRCAELRIRAREGARYSAISSLDAVVINRRGARISESDRNNHVILLLSA